MEPTSRADAKLLRPSLAPDLSARGFRRPWRPTSLLYAAFWGGPVAGGVLAALNWQRLGQPGRGRWALLWTLPVALGLPLLLLARQEGWTEGTVFELRLSRVLLVAVAVGFTYAVSRAQHGLVNAFEAQDGKPASLWLPGLAAIVLGRLAEFAFALLFFLVAHLALGVPLRSG